MPAQEFRPELLSRRGEGIAWASTLMVGLGWLVLRLSGQRPPGAVVFLGLILLLAALSISLGNWMDRHTLIRLDTTGIEFTNGLRHVRLPWEEIRQVRVLPSRWGSKVQVFGARAYFHFRTLGEVRVQGELKGRMGFEKGEEILQQIIQNSQLQLAERSNEEYDYTRR
jgi:hypothetical protein